jgi:hypothetical protein
MSPTGPKQTHARHAYNISAHVNAVGCSGSYLIIAIACLKLSRMRLNETVSDEISSLPGLRKGSTFSSPKLTASAIAETRLSMRRFTRLTNAFSKKLENLQAAVALHFAHYNLVRLHKTLRVTPAMAANVTDRIWSLDELVERTSA